MRGSQKRQIDWKITSSTETPGKLASGQMSDKIKGVAGTSPRRPPAPPLPPALVQTIFPTSWDTRGPRRLKPSFLSVTELSPAVLDTGPVGTMADGRGVNISLVTPRPWNMPGLEYAGKAEARGPRLGVPVGGARARSRGWGALTAAACRSSPGTSGC